MTSYPQWRPAGAGQNEAERVIMSLAARQHGVVARTQLLQAGITSDIVEYRLKVGRLSRLHRGVYLVGPLVVPNTREMAAVLACGGSAAVSHHSAAGVWLVLSRVSGGKPVEIAVSRGRAGPRPGIRIRHLHSLLPDEVTVHDAVPITTPARTLLDLAGTASDRELERAVAEAIALRLVERSRVLALLDRHPRSPGVSRLRRLLDSGSQIARTRSEAEERLLALVRKARLPHPELNTKVQGHEVDFLWRTERLVVDVDGRAFHSSDRRFERDRSRDAALVAAGIRVMRVTWLQIVNEREALLVRLAQALARQAEL